MAKSFASNLGSSLGTLGNNLKTNLGNIGTNIGNFGDRVNTALYGIPTADYGKRNNQYIDMLRGREDFQNLATQNNMSVDEAVKGVMQGLNFGSKKIADEQKALGIRTPNENQVDLAREGLFNKYGETREGGFFKDHPILSALGMGAVGGGLNYLGQELNEPYVYNKIASRYYGDRYTPVLPQADDQWSRRMTQGIQGLLMGNTGDPIEFQKFQ